MQQGHSKGTGDRRLDAILKKKAAVTDSPFFTDYVFPYFDDQIRDEIKRAKTVEEVFRAQGKLQLLDEIREVVKSAALKNLEVPDDFLQR